MKYIELQFPVDSLFLVTGGEGFIGPNLCYCADSSLNMMGTAKQTGVWVPPQYDFDCGLDEAIECYKANL